MPKNPRILYFSTQFPTLRSPSMGVFSLQRVRALHRAGCDVIVVNPLLMTPPPRLIVRPVQAYRWIKSQAQQPSAMELQGIPAYYPKWICPPKKIFGWYMSLFLYMQVQKVSIQLAKTFHPDVILSSWLPDAVAASKLGNELNIPVLAIADGSDLNLWPDEYPRWKYARDILNEKVSVIIFVSEALKAVGTSRLLYGRKNFVLHNAVDIHQFEPASCPHNRDAFTILAVGRLVPAKGFQFLLRAVAQLNHQFKEPAHLILVGDGSQRDALIVQAKNLGISSIVEFVGSIQQEKLVKYYQDSDVFCLPSFSEGFPCVVVEAMACGKPVVASRVGGIAEVVDEQSGILVTPGDAGALCEAFLQVKKRKWDGEIIRKKIVAGFGWETWSETMIHLMDAASI